MPQDTNNVIVASLLAVALAVFGWVITRPSGASSRADIVDQFEESARQTGRSGEQGFDEQVVSQTGYLPSGFDVAGRIGLNNEQDFGDGSGGFVGL